MMEKNVGGYDRLVRFVVGPALIVVALAAFGGSVTLASGTLGLVLAAVALLAGVGLTVTAAVQRCSVNALLGIDTFRKRSAPSSTDDAPPGTKQN